MAEAAVASKRSGFLPPIGSVKYHVMLGAVAILVLGPLGGITAAYMNFSLGFFVGGQVLAGILGSVVTYGYGPEGKHGANYMQTMAASVASMGAMGVLTQAMIWLGLPEPPIWALIVYFLCIGMLGVGIGMLYTPVLVDRLQLTYPSGLAVANILRALTDKKLLKRSISQLGTGSGIGIGGFFVTGLELKGLGGKPWGLSLEAMGFSASTLGAGMVVGARIGVPAIVVGALGEYVFLPYLQNQHCALGVCVSDNILGEKDPFRKVGFLVALGSILGAAVVDLALIFRSAIQRLREKRDAKVTEEDRKNMRTGRLLGWVGFWAAATLVVATQVMKVPILYAGIAIALCFLFVLVNGISQGISDSNPISSAFVVSVILLAVAGLTDPGVGLLAGGILLVACSVGCDMQQDRSTGWRLGSNRIVQFRYQVIGVTMGAICAVVISKLFMDAYPVLKENAFTHPEIRETSPWQSAMTYKFAGVLSDITNPKPMTTRFLLLGLAIGLVLEVSRKLLKSSEAYKRFREGSPTGKVTDFIIDAILLPSPYAASFGGFVDLATSVWFGGGGILSSTINWWGERNAKAKAKEKPADAEAEEELPEDMSSTSLIGGGLIAGESLGALMLGIAGLVKSLLVK